MDIDDGFQPHKIILVLVGRVIGSFFVALRFYARHKGGTRLWWDDWLLVVPVIGFFIPASVLDLWQVIHLGWGKRIAWIAINHPENLEPFAKAQYANTQLYAPIVVCIKCSILCLYVRTFGVHKSMVRVSMIQIVLVCIWGLVTVLLFIFQCNPVHLGWSIDRSAGTCFTYRSLFVGTNVVNIIADFAILLTPLPYVWGLQLRAFNKAIVSGVLVLGTGACVFSTVRLAQLSRLTFQDPSRDGMEANLWSSFEGNIGIICACIPTLGPLIARWRSAPASSKTPKNSGKNKSSSKNTTSGQEPWRDDERRLVSKGSLVQGSNIHARELGSPEERNNSDIELQSSLNFRSDREA